MDNCGIEIGEEATDDGGRVGGGGDGGGIEAGDTGRGITEVKAIRGGDIA